MRPCPWCGSHGPHFIDGDLRHCKYCGRDHFVAQIAEEQLTKLYTDEGGES